MIRALTNRIVVPNQVVFVGDSHIARMEWNALLQANQPIVNLGVGGHGVAEFTTQVLPIAKKWQPKALVVELGTNDVDGATKPDWRTVADQAIAKWSALLPKLTEMGVPLVVMSVPPSSDTWVNAATKKLNKWLAENIPAAGGTFVDLTTALALPTSTLNPLLARPDVKHLNLAGYQAIAGRIEQAVIAATLPEVESFAFLSSAPSEPWQTSANFRAVAVPEPAVPFGAAALALLWIRLRGSRTGRCSS